MKKTKNITHSFKYKFVQKKKITKYQLNFLLPTAIPKETIKQWLKLIGTQHDASIEER